MNKHKTIPFKSKAKPKSKIQLQEAPNFDDTPIPTLCMSIQMIMDNMTKRGYPVHDFDNKDKTVKQIQMIGGKVYFLAVGKEAEHE